MTNHYPNEKPNLDRGFKDVKNKISLKNDGSKPIIVVFSQGSSSSDCLAISTELKSPDVIFDNYIITNFFQIGSIILFICIGGQVEKKNLVKWASHLNYVFYFAKIDDLYSEFPTIHPIPNPPTSKFPLNQLFSQNPVSLEGRSTNQISLKISLPNQKVSKYLIKVFRDDVWQYHCTKTLADSSATEVTSTVTNLPVNTSLAVKVVAQLTNGRETEASNIIEFKTCSGTKKLFLDLILL
jgi:hypothetical protein